MLWQQLDLDSFWRPRLPPSREGTPWLLVLQTLVAYRLIVIALIVTPEGFPLSYEVLSGNTADATTLAVLHKVIRANRRLSSKQNETLH